MAWYDRLMIALLVAACGFLVGAFLVIQERVVVDRTTPVTIVETPTTTVDPDFTVACFDIDDLTRVECT